jgi:hypothetical protein
MGRDLKWKNEDSVYMLFGRNWWKSEYRKDRLIAGSRRMWSGTQTGGRYV